MVEVLDCVNIVDKKGKLVLRRLLFAVVIIIFIITLVAVSMDAAKG